MTELKRWAPFQFGLNNLAWSVHVARVPEGYGFAESLARQALKRDPESHHAQHTLALLLADQGKWDEALGLCPAVLDALAAYRLEPDDLAEFLLAAARAGHGEDVLRLVEQSSVSQDLKPLLDEVKAVLEQAEPSAG